jgi:hydrogenase-4 component F
MIWIFLAATLIICAALLLNRNKFANYSLVALYTTMLLAFGIYEYLHLNTIQCSFFKPDSLGVLLLLVLCFIAVPVLYHSYKYIERDNPDETPGKRGLYFAAIILLITACGTTYLSDHIAVTWIFLEITTLSASALIYHHRNIRALEGTWKYIFICAISITLIYMGILFLSLSMKYAGIEDISFSSLVNNYSRLNPFWLKLAFLFIYTGITAKLGLVPMYTAGVDAKDKAPAPVGALMASVLMNVGFVTIYRVYAIVAHTSVQGWADNIIMIAAVLSVFVATVYMTRIKNIKRMFAYSGIEHMGLVMVALSAGGIGVYAAILHILLHTLVKPSLFLQYNQIYRVYQSKSMYDVGNYFKYNKSGAVLILLGFISVTAMPPSALFVSEFMIFQSLFQAHNIVILLFLLILLTFIIWGLGVNIFKLLFTPPVSFDDSRVPHISPWESLPQYLLLAASVYLAYNPPAKLVTMIEEAVKLIQ